MSEEEIEKIIQQAKEKAPEEYKEQLEQELREHAKEPSVEVKYTLASLLSLFRERGKSVEAWFYKVNMEYDLHLIAAIHALLNDNPESAARFLRESADKLDKDSEES